jgi:Rrf2 family protein
VKLPSKSRIGTRILVDLSGFHRKRPVQIGEISRRQDISVKYLEQLIRPLKNADLIVSSRGPKGGHMLARPPSEITLAEIARVYEKNAGPERCLCTRERCHLQDECLLHRAWKEANDAFYERLGAVTVADLGNECCE